MVSGRISGLYRKDIMNITLPLLTTLFVSVLFNIILLRLVSYLGISPSFGIPSQALGQLMVRITTGARIWVYGDIDKLNLVNDALKSEKMSGMRRWNQIMTLIQEKIRADEKFLIFGGDEFGWGLRLNDTRFGRHATNPKDWEQVAISFCTRLQSLLKEFNYSESEKLELIRLTGRPYVSVTLAYAYSSCRKQHRMALNAAELCVINAKPKDAVGQRGQILRAA